MDSQHLPSEAEEAILEKTPISICQSSSLIPLRIQKSHREKATLIPQFHHRRSSGPRSAVQTAQVPAPAVNSLDLEHITILFPCPAFYGHFAT